MAWYVHLLILVTRFANYLIVTHVQARALESHANHINQRAEKSVLAS